MNRKELIERLLNDYMADIIGIQYFSPSRAKDLAAYLDKGMTLPSDIPMRVKAAQAARGKAIRQLEEAQACCSHPDYERCGDGTDICTQCQKMLRPGRIVPKSWLLPEYPKAFVLRGIKCAVYASDGGWSGSYGGEVLKDIYATPEEAEKWVRWTVDERLEYDNWNQ